MSDSPETLITLALSAWAEDAQDDIEHLGYREPLLQTDVIPLACVWSLANAIMGEHPGTVFLFTQDVLAHEKTSEAWRELAEIVGDYNLYDEEVSYQWHLGLVRQSYEAGVLPNLQEIRALEDGRPVEVETITGLEMSLISALGHAVYNALDGRQVIQLNPLGPPKDEPVAWLSPGITGERVRTFAHDNLLRE